MTMILLVVSSLTSCTVPSDGHTGITVDAEGDPVAVLQTCKHAVDGATLYVSSKSGTGSQSLGDWDFDVTTVGTALRWPLMASEAPGVRATRTVAQLEPGVEYHLYGWTYDNDWSTGHVTFTMEDLERLQQGRILVYGGNDKDPRGNDEVSVADFQASVCGED